MLHLVEGTMRRLNAGVLGLDRTPGELARQRAAAAAAAAAAAVAEAVAGEAFCCTALHRVAQCMGCCLPHNTTLRQTITQTA